MLEQGAEEQRTSFPISLRFVAPAAPYVAVVVGLLVLKSAWAAWLVYQLEMVFVLTAERQWFRLPMLARSARPLLVVAASLLTASAGVAIYVLAPVLGLAGQASILTARLGLTASTFLPFILCVALTNPWLEELYWRGYLGTDAPSPQLADAWFAGYHAVILVGFVVWWWFVPVCLVLAAAAWAWRQSVKLTDGLLLAAASHLTADVAVLLAVWALAGSSRSV